jgi:hypothetical protein
MGIWRNRFLSVLVSVVIVFLAMSGAGIQASASPVPGPNFSTPQGIDAYLQSRGINPGAVIRQTGLKNYVGNSCPGTGWHCIAPTHTPVVQIAPAGGVNVFTCSADVGSGSCFVLQISTGAPTATTGDPPPVTNQYTCNEQSSATPTADLDSATCGSLMQRNTNGNNQATIVQQITQHSAGMQSATEMAGSPITPLSQMNVSGNNQITIGQASMQSSSDMPTSAQTIYVSQVNGSGQNQATVSQSEQQQVSDAASTQDQEGTQVACLTQDSPNGRNQATVGQLMSQHEQDSAAPISQIQNRSPGPVSSCGSGPGESFTTINPNLASFVLQNQNTPTATGQNQLTDKQSLQQQQQSTASSGTVSQQQGPNFDQGGMEAVPAQTSTGLSTANTSQNEQQNMQASTTGPLSQTQNDPMHQPTGEGFQASNPNDTFTLTQTGVQQAGPAAQQNFDIQGDCTSSGTCNVQSTDTSNGVTTSRSCGPGSCSTTVSNVEECDAPDVAPAGSAQSDWVCDASRAS